ncbi:MAG: hypothetical protein ACLPUX_06025 [Syntrophobacteraceae bacterium]
MAITRRPRSIKGQNQDVSPQRDSSMFPVCLFVQYRHFAALGKLRLCGPLPRTYGTIYALLSIFPSFYDV